MYVIIKAEILLLYLFFLLCDYIYIIVTHIILKKLYLLFVQIVLLTSGPLERKRVLLRGTNNNITYCGARKK